MSQHVVGSRLTSNIKITLKIKFTSQIFADISRSLVVVLQHLRFCKKILILIFFSDLFSIECKFFCPNSADNTMENRAISLVESSRDNSLISCPTSSEPVSRLCGYRIHDFHKIRVRGGGVNRYSDRRISQKKLFGFRIWRIFYTDLLILLIQRLRIYLIFWFGLWV